MTLPILTKVPVDPFHLDAPALAHHLAALLADEASSTRALCLAISASCWHRLRDTETGTADVLTPSEWICVDALDLDAQVFNGGFQQWVQNGYWGRGYQTYDALVAIGAPRTARLLSKALRALPPHAQAALDCGVADSALPYLGFGPRRETYFGRLDTAYYALESVENIDALVAAYARRVRGGAVRPPVP